MPAAARPDPTEFIRHRCPDLDMVAALRRAAHRLMDSRDALRSRLARAEQDRARLREELATLRRSLDDAHEARLSAEWKLRAAVAHHPD